MHFKVGAFVPHLQLGRDSSPVFHRGENLLLPGLSSRDIESMRKFAVFKLRESELCTWLLRELLFYICKFGVCGDNRPAQLSV